jgi:protein phosphatase
MTRDPEMAALIAANQDPQVACAALIAAANKAGGDDNITCILARFDA